MKYLTIIIFLFVNLSIFAQYTYVPDDNFEQALIDLGYDTGPLDDYVPTANINGLTSLDVSDKDISDLTGIEDFTALLALDCHSNNLTNINVSENISLGLLYCFFNQLTSLDLSQNTDLTYLSCSSNQLTNINVTQNTNLINLNCQTNQLTSLDLSQNTNLTYLNCHTNQLTNINVTQNTNLTDLNCSANQLTNLNVTQNTVLTDLYCSVNQLANLDISQNINLTLLHCYSNQLINLDVSQNTVLADLICSTNQLTNLDVSQNVVLSYLICSQNQLTSLDISQNVVLTDLLCSQNQITDLDISQNIVLTDLYCFDNQLINLDVSQNTDLTKLYCYSNQLTDIDIRNGNNENITNFIAIANTNLTCIFVDNKNAGYLSSWNIDPISTFVETEAECNALFTYVPDDNFEQELIDLGYDPGELNDYVLTANISEITSLDVNNKSISDLTGIEDFVALIFLNCSNNQLSTLNISQNTNLISLGCDNNQLTNLNLSHNSDLQSLYCFQNQLISLDVRNENNANFSDFQAQSNQNLICIFVDDKDASYLSDWTIDPASTFVETEAECDALSGVDNIINGIDFALYPNPAKEKFSILTSNEIENLSIYDIYGKLLKVYKKQDTYSVSDLAGGVYLIHVHNKEGLLISKLVIE